MYVWFERRVPELVSVSLLAMVGAAPKSLLVVYKAGLAPEATGARAKLQQHRDQLKACLQCTRAVSLSAWRLFGARHATKREVLYRSPARADKSQRRCELQPMSSVGRGKQVTATATLHLSARTD